MRHTKKKLIVLFILFIAFTTASLYAVANTQKQYTVSSTEWQTAASLCRIAGVVGPSSSGPVAGTEILQALKAIDIYKLSSNLQKTLEDLFHKLENPSRLLSGTNYAIDLETIINAEAYVHTSPFEDITERDWLKGYQDRLPFAEGVAEGWFGDHIYGLFTYSAMKNLQPAGEKHPYFYPYFNTNIYFRLPTMQRTMPFQVGIFAGDNVWNFTIGRNRASMGNGKTGNLLVGDNFQFQEFMKLSLFTPLITYNLNITHFDQQNKALDDPTTLIPFRLNRMHQIRSVHRLSVNIAKNFQITLSECTLFQMDSSLDWRLLNPFMFMHNYNNFERCLEANNMFSLELDYTFLPSWSWHAQAVVDQIQLPSEIDFSEEEGEAATLAPNAWGVLTNFTGTWGVGKGYLEGFLEGVYTSPYLYLNRKALERNFPGEVDWNHDFIVGYRLTDSNDLSYSGYKFGPDSIVAALGLSYHVFGDWSCNGQIMYKAQGQHGIAWPGSNKSQEEEIGIDHINDWSPTGIPEHLLSIFIDGKKKFMEGLEIGGSLGFISVWNFKHEIGRTWQDLQLSIAVSIDPLALILKR